MKNLKFEALNNEVENVVENTKGQVQHSLQELKEHSLCFPSEQICVFKQSSKGELIISFTVVYLLA